MALTPYVLPVTTGGDGKKRARKDQHETAVNNAIGSLKTEVDGIVAGLQEDIDGKLENTSATNRLLGRKTAGTGAVEPIAPVRGISIDVDGVGLAEMPQATFKGRVAGAGTGAPTDVTVAQAKAALAYTKGDVGLGNADNTADVNKPLSPVMKSTIRSSLDAQYAPNMLAVARGGGAIEPLPGGIAGIRGVVIRGAQRGRIYRVARYQNGSTVGGVAHGIVITSIGEDRLWENGTERIDFDRNISPVTNVLSQDGSRFLRYVDPNSGIEVIIIFDTTLLPASGTAFISLADGADGWSHFISPKNYYYKDRRPIGLRLLRERLWDPLASVRLQGQGDSITAGRGAPGDVIVYPFQEFAATEGQYIFSLNASLEGAETVQVKKNGVILGSGEYTKTGATLTLTVGATAGDAIRIDEREVFHSLLTRPGPHTSGSWMNRLRLGLIQATMGRYNPTLTSAASETGAGRMSRGAYQVSAVTELNPVTAERVAAYDAQSRRRDKNIYTSSSTQFGKALNLLGGERARFKVYGNNITFVLAFLGVDMAATFDVYVDGVLAQAFPAEVAGFGYVKTVTFAYGAHDIEVHNKYTIGSQSQATIRIESIRHQKLLMVANSGVSGTRTSEWKPGSGSGVAVDIVGSSLAEFVLIGLGPNDRDWASGEKRFSYFDNIEQIIDYHQASGRYPILIAHMFVDDANDAPNAPYNTRMAEYVRDMRNIAARKAVDFIDAWSVMARYELSKNAATVTNIETEIATTALSNDGTHPNGLGHALIADEVLRHILFQVEELVDEAAPAF